MRYDKAHIIRMLAITIVMSVLTCSCREKKGNNPAIGDLKNITNTELILKTADQKADYQYLNANIKAAVKRNSSVSVHLMGQMRIKHDSIIWINLTAPLGLGSMRIMVTNDSVWIANSLDKTCRCGKLDDALNQFGIKADFASVENALVGNGTILPKDRFTALYDSLTFSDDTFVVPIKQSSADMLSINEIQITPTLKTRQIMANYGAKGKIELNYSNFIDTEIGPMPSRLQLLFNSHDEMKVAADYYKIIINQKSDFPFKMSESFRIIDIK